MLNHTYCPFELQVNGSYPYAFLEKAPEPWGIVASAVILVVGVQVSSTLTLQPCSLQPT